MKILKTMAVLAIIACRDVACGGTQTKSAAEPAAEDPEE